MQIVNALYSMRMLEELALKNTAVHRINPAVKLLVTLIFSLLVVSYNKYETLSILPFLFYLAIIIPLAELPLSVILKRIAFVEPFILFVGILNPVFDSSRFVVAGFSVSGGWLVFLSIMIKGTFTVAAAVVLLAVTGMEGIAAGLRFLRVPKIFVLQLLLTYRYISVLSEQTACSLQAYSLRSVRAKGIKLHAAGSFIGRLILKTFDKAERIYQAMCARGFTGDFYSKRLQPLKGTDVLYLLIWTAVFVLFRLINWSSLIGLFLTGSKA